MAAQVQKVYNHILDEREKEDLFLITIMFLCY